MLPTLEELWEMREMDIMEADREQLADIGDIHIDENKTVGERIAEFLEQARNPYLMKAGEYILKFDYTDCGKDLEERLLEYVSGLTKSRS